MLPVPLRITALLAFSFLLAACGKSDSAKSSSAAESKPAASSAAKSPPTDAQLDAEISQSLSSSSAPSSPSAASVASREAALAAEAEDILSRYPDKNAAELLNVPEVNGKLRAALQKLGQDEALKKQIERTVDLAAKMKGLDGPPGSANLDLDITKYDRDRKSRMLQTVLSEDPRQIVSFLSAEIGEAAPELSFGGADRAENGVAIRPKEQPKPAK